MLMGWEVEIDMSGQANNNVKMKKKITGAEMGHIFENVRFMEA